MLVWPLWYVGLLSVPVALRGTLASVFFVTTIVSHALITLASLWHLLDGASSKWLRIVVCVLLGPFVCIAYTIGVTMLFLKLIELLF